MAKIEVQNIKKTKGKKRKHNNAPHEDEVANKSVIVEKITLPEAKSITSSKIDVQVTETKSTKKRKNKDKGAVKEKCFKSSEVDYTELKVESKTDFDDIDLRQPSLEQLKECENPENTLAIVTGRQKKKQKLQKLLAVKKDHSVEREILRNEEYLNKWKNAKDEWKFEKLRQISIQQTMFEEDKLNAVIWSIALEYLAGSKGLAKHKIVKLANEVIDGVDKLSEMADSEEKKQTLLNSVKYQRARDLLQIFD